jgi:serine/threonine protein phosphatase PrpC
VHVLSWGASDVGQARKVNEDAFLLEKDLGLVAVADGMGGFQRGDVASQVACNVLKETVSDNRDTIELYRQRPNDSTRGAVKAMLESAIQRACEEVHQAAVDITGEGGRIGTTMDAMLVVGSTAFIAHVGDGRIYLQRGREVHQLTEDHSLVAQQIREGKLTPEQARKARFKNVITRALGVFPSVLVDTLHFELDVGDRLLLCSDGLYRYLGLRELGFTLMGEVHDGTATRLVDVANSRGGRDNITAVICLARPEGDAETIAPTAERMEVLRKVDLFQYCTYRELIELCQIADQREVTAGTLLFEEQDPGREAYFIVSGKVAIEKNTTRLATLGPGDYFGELAFIDSPKRSARARVLEDGVFLVMHRDRFLQLMKQDADLSVKLMWQLLRKLADVVRNTNDRLVADTISLDSLSLSELEEDE